MKQFEKNNKNFIVRLLNKNDVESSFNLLEKVVKEMNQEGHGNYLISKSKEQIEATISEGNNKVAGVFLLDNEGKEETLVAEMTCRGILKDSMRDETDDFLPNFDAKNIPNNEIDYIGSTCVSSEFRRQGMFKVMNNFLSSASSKRYIVRTAEISNHRICGAILNEGFFITQETVDPYDGASIFYFIKDKKMKLKNKDVVKTSDYKNLYYELKNGFVGCGIDKITNEIQLMDGTEINEHFGCNNRPIINENKEIKEEKILCLT